MVQKYNTFSTIEVIEPQFMSRLDNQILDTHLTNIFLIQHLMLDRNCVHNSWYSHDAFIDHDLTP